MIGARSDRKGRSTGKRANRREGEAIGPRGAFIYQELRNAHEPRVAGP